jgi:membrane carboxypeptidase/penicillin-binding protein
MGKTGTTNEFRDALFVGSTFGPEGITIAVRVGFDDNRSLGPQETGGRVALPVFKEIMLRVYRDKLVGPVPEFPAQIEQRISDYLKGDSVSPLNPSNPPTPLSVRVADGVESVSTTAVNIFQDVSNTGQHLISTWPMIEKFSSA